MITDKQRKAGQRARARQSEIQDTVQALIEEHAALTYDSLRLHIAGFGVVVRNEDTDPVCSARLDRLVAEVIEDHQEPDDEEYLRTLAAELELCARRLTKQAAKVARAG